MLQQRDVPAPHFGEGITVWKNDLIELTWQTHVAFVYDRATFTAEEAVHLPGRRLGPDAGRRRRSIMSDGTDELRFSIR